MKRIGTVLATASVTTVLIGRLGSSGSRRDDSAVRLR